MSLTKLLAVRALAVQARRAKAMAETRLAVAATKAATALVAALFALIALVFAALAAFFWLDQTQPPHIAALWVAGGLLVLALLTWLIGSARARSRGRAVPTRRPDSRPAGGGGGGLDQSAMDKGYEIGAQVNDTLKRHPYGAMGAALAVGVAVALFSQRRRPPED